MLLAYNRSDVYRLNSILINWFRKELADSKQRSILLSHLGTYYYPSVTMIACTAISIFVFVLHPVLSVLTQHLHHEETIVYDLNVPQKTPWDISHNGVLFCIEYILLSMLNYTILLSIAVDVFFAYYAFVITNLFKLLSYKFTNLAHDVKNQGELKSLIRQHQLLMSCKRNLETPFGPVILGLCITSAVTMCTIAYQLYQVNNYLLLREKYYFIIWILQFCLFVQMKEIDVRLVVRESTHLFVKGVQAFMYSWYTNEITRAVRSEWNNNNYLHFRLMYKLFIFFLIRAMSWVMLYLLATGPLCGTLVTWEMFYSYCLYHLWLCLPVDFSLWTSVCF